MKAQILTEDQIPEALSIARGVFDYCLRARITDLEMIHIFLQYTENTNIRNMIAEGTLTMWGIFEQGHMIAMSGMQKEGHITMLYVLPVFQRRGCGRCLLEEMKAYAANQYQLQRVTLSAMPAWTADYFTKRRFHPMEVTQPCSFVPMQAKTVARAIYEKKEIPSGVILGTSIGGLAVCAAVAVGFMVLYEKSDIFYCIICIFIHKICHFFLLQKRLKKVTICDKIFTI